MPGLRREIARPLGLDNDEQFHIRTGNSIKRLHPRETVEYVKERWKE